MKALISPIEPVQSGYRVAQVEQSAFDVALPLFWVDCTNEIKADRFWYDPLDQSLKLVPITLPSAEQNKETAESILASTDWVNQPDVTNPDINPHLINQSEFLVYRSLIRAIAINPTEGNLDWPIKPDEEWSSV